MFHPDDQERAWATWRHSLDTGEPYHIEYRLRHRSGAYRWVLGRAQPVRDEAGRITRWFGTCTEIQDLVEARETLERQVAERTAALEASRTRLRAIFESSFQLQGLVALDGTLIEANATALAAIAAPANAAIGGKFWDTPWFTATPGAPALIEGAFAATLRGETTRIELILDMPVGQRIYDFSMRPLRDAAGEIIGAVPEAVDITERREVEEALRQSQKLEAMGQLTGGVAHDFNNLLTPIIGGLDLLQRRGLGGAREQRLIDGAMASAERARLLVQRLLSFARRQPLQQTAVAIAPLIAGMAELIASTLGPQIDLDFDIADELPSACADANQLEMALLNLCVNARDAMGSGGSLRIAAALACPSLARPLGLEPGAYVRIAVTDTGAGMDAATLARAIEPFFSTKGVGKGTGLGLSMVHGLASQLGGALDIASAPGAGTTVALWLPATADAALADDRVASAPRVHSGSVLLVDDEELVRASTADMLGELGFTVREARSADDALLLLEHGERFDLLITDHLMPGMTGIELARLVRARTPSLPVLIVSGFAEAEGVAADLPRLTKPFRASELAAALATLADA